MKRFLISACRRYVAFGLLSGFLVLAFAGHAIAWSWIYLGNDAGGDHNSGKQSLDMVEFYYNLDDTYLSFKIVCAATPPNNSAGENYGITYEVRLDTKPGGYTYYNDQWNTDREWDYSIQLDYPAGGLIASLYKYDGAGDWMFVQNVPHEMGDPDAVILKVPLGEIEFVDDTIYVQFNTNDRSGDYWWFADISSVLTLDITPPTVPSLIWPENNQNILDNTPTFVWTPVSDPSGVTYQIQIDDNVDFSSPIYFAVDLVDNWHTLPDENSLTLFVQYFWRVRAVDGAGNVGEWSEKWNFTVTTRVSFTLELRAGVNLISFPVMPDNTDPDSVFLGDYVMSRWNAEDQEYVQCGGSEFEPDEPIASGVGYWVKVPADENIVVSGTPVDNLTLSLKAGWNLIGSPLGGASIADPDDTPDNSVLPHAHTWDAAENKYVLTQQLEAGKGYWVNALNDCVLRLGGGYDYNVAPVVTGDPEDTTVTYGGDATFTAAATGMPTPTVQWQGSNDGGTTWFDIPGETSTTLTVTQPPVSYSGYRYRAVFTNSEGSATTNAATLTVNKKELTVTDITVKNKEYDGTTTATPDFTSALLVGVVGSDDVSLDTSGYTATFASADVGTGISVTVSGLGLGGTDAGNYTLIQPSGLTADITEAKDNFSEWDNYEIGSAAAGSHITVNFVNTLFENIDFDVKNNIQNAQIVQELVDRPSNISTGPADNPYGYLRVILVNINENDIENIVLKFKVEKSWITANSIDEGTITLNRWNDTDNTWTSYPTTKIGEDDNYLFFSVNLPHLSIFVIRGSVITTTTYAPPPVPSPPPGRPPTPPPSGTPAFALQSLIINPTQVRVGEAERISVTVINTGTGEGTCTVELRVNGALTGTRTVTLNAGWNHVMTFYFTPGSEGTYLVEIGGLTGSFSVVTPPGVIPLSAITFLIVVVVIGELLGGIWIRSRYFKRRS